MRSIRAIKKARWRVLDNSGQLFPISAARLLDFASEPLPNVRDDETQILSSPLRLHRSGREIKMRVDGIGPFAAAKPDAPLIKLLIRARRFNAVLIDSDAVPLLHWPSDYA